MLPPNVVPNSERSRAISLALPYVIALGLLIGILWIQVRMGGTRGIFALPGYAVIAVTGMLSLWSLVASKKGEPAPSALCLISATLFFGYLLCRTLASPVEYLARTNLYLILASLIVYFLTTTLLTGVRPRLTMLAGFLVAEVFHLAVGLIQFVQGNNYLPFGYVRPDYGSRASGFYACPNHFAGFLECLLLLASSVALFGRLRVWARILLIYLSTIACVGVAISGSRGGYLSTCVGLLGILSFGIIYGARLVPHRFGRLLAAGLVVLCALGGLAFLFGHRSELLVHRFGTIVDPKNMRLLLWAAALKQFALNPAFGTGASTYLIYGRRFRDLSVQADPIYTHNDYLQLLAEYGVIGITLFVLFLSAHLWNATLFARRMLDWQQKKRENFSSSLGFTIGATLGVVALIVHSVVDFNLQIPGNTLFVAFLFGILANPGVDWKKDSATTMIHSWVWRLAPALLAIPIFFFGAPTIPAEIDAEKARLALSEEKYALSVASAKEGIQKDPRNPELFYYLGESRRQLGSRFAGPASQSLLQASSDAFDRGLALFPMDERLLVKDALTNAQLGDFSKADALFQRAFEWSPNLGAVYAFYGLRLQLENRLEEAKAAYEKANQMTRNSVSIAGLQQTLEKINRARAGGSQ
jgi:O-antigen ligase